MAQLGIQHVFIAGHDFGAAVVWWLLLFHPQRFQSAAMLNVPHPHVFWHKLRSSPGSWPKAARWLLKASESLALSSQGRCLMLPGVSH